MARRAKKSQPEAPGLFDLPQVSRVPPVSEARAEDRPEAQPATPRALSVSELTREIKQLLEGTGRLSVEGELSGLKRHTSGHIYFDLKDDGARISCAVWRSRAERAFPFEPEEGMQVVVHGKLDVYAPRGSYSLIVERVAPLGIGAMLAQLEALKSELKSLGWFERSRSIPFLPRSVGVVTSRDGAALRDFLRTRSLRWLGYPVRLCHSAVQGPGAAQSIAAAVARLDASGVDVIVLCRGGGSLEDLWAFNERAVAEAVWQSSVPVVSGVGHESDTTLVDWIADRRAHTPTDAAQVVFPDRSALFQELERHGNYLTEALAQELDRRGDRLRELAGRPVLRSPDWIVERRREVLGSHAARLTGSLGATLEREYARVQTLHVRLERQAPRVRLERWAARLSTAGERLRRDFDRRLERRVERLGSLAAGLESFSPLKVLGRGYSLTHKTDGKTPIRSADEIKVGDEILTRFAEGGVRSLVSERVQLDDKTGDDPARSESR